MHRALVFLLGTGLLMTPANAQPVSIAMIDRIAQADQNCDGAVTRAEFTAWRTGQFARIDRNGDGFLSAADQLRGFAGRNPLGIDIAAMTTQFDTNRDGRVSAQEFQTGPTPAFDTADANRDNTVTRAEMDAARAARKGAR
jgi:hypothetical protein